LTTELQTLVELQTPNFNTIVYSLPATTLILDT
jgi:hypothetical protein